MTVACTYCRAAIPSSTAYRRVTGWEKKSHGPHRRGGSDIILREQRDEFACLRCINRLQSNLAPLQESLGDAG